METKHGKKYTYEVITLPPPETNSYIIEARSLVDECNGYNEDGVSTLKANNEEVKILFEEGVV